MRIVLLALLVVGFISAGQVAADPIRLAAEPLRIESTEVTSTFPVEIVFSVVAQSDTAEIVALELAYRVSGDAYTRSRWPDFTPAERVQAAYSLDTQVEHYPPGTQFHYYWTVTDAAGQTVESDVETFIYVDDRFAWQDLSTERVAVHWYEGDEGFGQQLRDAAVRALDRLERDAGVEAERQVQIYVYGNSRDFRGALGPNSPEWIGGQALPHLALIVAHISPSMSEYGEIERMIPHEISHVVLYQATHNPYTSNPNWLEEGIAVHNQEVADADFPALVQDAAREGRLIPLRALSASFPSDTDLALLSYAESLSIVEFILDRYGEEGLSDLVDVLAEGETADIAVERALGVTLDELEAEWRATLPVAERTPVPGETPRSGETPGPFGLNIDGWMRLLGSAMACTFCLSILVVISVVVVLIRRRSREQEEDTLDEAPPYTEL
jgi:hypothetical protein